MTKQLSFTKYENKVLPNFRQKINMAESTEDVKKFFIQTAKELFIDIFGLEKRFEYEDFQIHFENEPHFILSDRVTSSEGFKSVWNESDLSRIMSKLVESAMGRYKHLKKRPEKSKSKIRM